jgi:hypothetical protein
VAARTGLPLSDSTVGGYANCALRGLRPLRTLARWGQNGCGSRRR